MRLISLGFACNNACIFCAQGELRARAAEPSDTETRLASIEPGELVALVGGEPTLAARLPDWVRLADERGAARVVVQTNGRRLAYRGYAAALRGSSSRLTLEVSLHGSSAPMHDYHTAAPGSFVQTVKGVRHAAFAGIPVAVTTVVTRSNFRHLVEITRLVHALGARALQLSLAVPCGSAARFEGRVIPARALVAPELAAALVEARALGLGYRIGARTSSPDIAGYFAGLGAIEARSPEERGARPPAAVWASCRPRLALIGRPVPALAEVRTQQRRTGVALRALFPSLFERAAPGPVAVSAGISAEGEGGAHVEREGDDAAAERAAGGGR